MHIAEQNDAASIVLFETDLLKGMYVWEGFDLRNSCYVDAYGSLRHYACYAMTI